LKFPKELLPVEPVILPPVKYASEVLARGRIPPLEGASCIHSVELNDDV
jgi:hypothetical protein